MLLKTIELDLTQEKSKFDIDVRMKYDTPFSMFELGLYD